jgi:hypothetical protein
VTGLLRLPLFYDPDATGARAPVEETKFLDTADELAARFGGGTLFLFRHDAPRGFWWDQGLVDRDVLALLEVDARRPSTALPAEGDLPEVRTACRAPDHHRGGGAWR